jgi:3-vinyl bacteriochlorophyllide hydratase
MLCLLQIFGNRIGQNFEEKNVMPRLRQKSLTLIGGCVSLAHRVERRVADVITSRSISAQQSARRGLYTAQERARRDASIWTLVQGILAPVQFGVFLVSLYLVVHFLRTGQGETAADFSIVLKTFTLYTIMITGSIWEKQVFGKWLFAEPFWWEDAFSMIVIALHTVYLAMLFGGIGSVDQRMFVALAAYASYAVNATQFILKLRAARLGGVAA